MENNEFVFNSVSRGNFKGITTSKFKIEDGKIHLHRFKRHFIFFKRKKEDFSGRIDEISNVEYTRTVNKIILTIIVIGAILSIFTGGVTAAFICAVFFGFYNKDVSINFKDGSKMMLNDIQTVSYVPKMVDLLKQTNPNITYDIKK